MASKLLPFVPIHSLASEATIIDGDHKSRIARWTQALQSRISGATSGFERMVSPGKQSSGNESASGSFQVVPVIVHYDHGPD